MSPLLDMKELLKPRYMRIGLDPYCQQREGQIFICDTEKQVEVLKSANKMYGSIVYKRLKWWEARKIIDMPQYINATRYKSVIHESIDGNPMFKRETKRGATIYKVKEYLTTGFIREDNNVEYFEICGAMPATKEEYEKYMEVFNSVK
jgi:hypothetical protein